MSSSTPITSVFLSNLTLKVKAKSIAWEGYQRANLLSPEDVTLIQNIVSAQPQKQQQLLESQGPTYASLYIRLLNKLSRNDTLQAILALISDMITDHDDRISLFLSLPESESPYPPLLKLLESQDDFVRLQSTILACSFIAYSPSSSSSSPLDSGTIAKVLSHLSSLIRNPNDPEGQDIGVQSLEGIFAVESVRQQAWHANEDEPGGRVIEELVQLLRSNPSSQMQYQLVFCFWLLTFDEPIAKAINAKYNLLPLLILHLRASIKEKVTRIIVSVFRNLISKAPSENLPAMLVARLLEVVEGLSGRKWSDEEVREDVEWVRDELKGSFEGLTTYDEYTSELQSGQLQWSPPHKNDEFWRENAAKLNDKDRKMLRVLVNHLIASRDSLVLAVAANDIAQYARYCEVGKKSLEDLGAKARVMELMTSHPDPDVKYQSLVATQMLISAGFRG
ncbi:ARM repeat-containing protein [Meredithblackwellia eburnea MCA 4105]